MRKKIFLRFFAVTLCATLLMFIFGFFAVKLNAEKVMTERLIEETKIVALLLDNEQDFSEFKAYEGNDKFRITVFDTRGNVLIESDTREELGNHIDREEVQYALNDSPKTVKRYSETFECEMTYYAMKVELDNGTTVILRLALRSSEMTSYLTVTLPLLIVVLIVALVISIVISHFISLNVSSKILDVGTSLKSVNKGEYVPINADASEPELYSVLCEINELNESTHTHIRDMEREQKKLSCVLDNVSQGIIAVNHMQEVAFMNKSTCEIFACNSSVVGKNIVNITDDLGLVSKITNHIFEDYSFEYTYGERELSILIHELQKDELTISSIIIITDITSERAVAKQKSEFFANASHELKTPITVMQGLSELLLEDEDIGKGAHKRIERIHKESVRLGSLISDMLKLSKLERGDEVELSTLKVDLGEVFSEVLDELGDKMNRKNISHSIAGTASVLADPKKIYELAENLLSNAVNYNKDGGSVAVELFEDENIAQIRVKDTGIGIDEKHIPMLCQRFYRVDKSHSKKTGGTGLGLAIVKHICALYGASLEIESKLGEGSTFIVKFNK